MIRWLGFILIVSGSSAAGITVANRMKQDIVLYRAVLHALNYVRTEIEFYLTPLDTIFEHLSADAASPLASLFANMVQLRAATPGLPMGILAKRCFALQENHFPKELAQILCDTFTLLGKQDILAQTRAIDAAVQRINEALSNLEKEKRERMRACRTIGVCAGLAIAILLV